MPILNPAIKREQLPSIESREGKRFAKKMIDNIVSGSMSINNIPEQYKKYIEGELKGRIPQSEFQNKLGYQIAPAAAATLAAPALVSLMPTVAAEIADLGAFLATETGKQVAAKAAVDLTTSTLSGEAINEAVKAKGYKGFGDAILQTSGVNPSTNHYNLYSGAADFLNPGYLLGSAATRGVAEGINQAISYGERKLPQLISRVNSPEFSYASVGEYRPGTAELIEPESRSNITVEDLMGRRPMATNATPEEFDWGAFEHTGYSDRTQLPSLPEEVHIDLGEPAGIPSDIVTADNATIARYIHDNVPASERGDFITNLTEERSNLRDRLPESSNSWNYRHVVGRFPRYENAPRYYDIEGLLKRGYSEEQIRNHFDELAIDPSLRGSNRANVAAQRLEELGVLPENISREEYLLSQYPDQDIYRIPYSFNPQGVRIDGAGPGAPVTFNEINDAIEAGIIPEEAFDRVELLRRPSEIHSYFEPRRTRTPQNVQDSNSTHPQPNDSQYPDREFMLALKEEAPNINTIFANLSGKEFEEFRPQIQKIVKTAESAYKNGDKTSVAKAWKDIQQLYTDKGKMFSITDIPSIEERGISVGGGYVPSEDFYSFLSAINGNHPPVSLGTAEYLSPVSYTADTLPLKYTKRSIGDYDHFSMFGANDDAISSMTAQMGNNLQHGATVFEGNKSLQSAPLAHMISARRAASGDGMIVFRGVEDNINHGPMTYDMLRTNNCAGLINRPFLEDGFFKADTFFDTVKKNASAYQAVLRETSPRTWKLFGGVKPSATIEVQTPTESRIIDLGSFSKSSEDAQWLKSVDEEIKSKIPSAIEEERGWNNIDPEKTYHVGGYDIQMKYPAIGFRKLNSGGILKRT